MDPQRWQHIQDIFWRVRSLDAAAREQELASLCADDHALRAEVRSLLAADSVHGILDDAEPLLAPLHDLLRQPVPENVGPYVIVDEIGRGGMGVVFRAHDPRLQRDVALKFLSPGLHLHPAARTRFIAEARAASALDHPNICTIYDVGSDADRLFIAMAYYPHGTLAQRLAQGPLPLPEAIDIAVQVAAALDCAHDVGIVHRDVKPANIAFGERGEVKVLDFGVAVLGDDADAAFGIVGTPAYMAPEQVRGEAVDRRADVWALGLVLYEMLSGQRPFSGPDRQTMLQAMARTEPDLLALRPDLPPAVVAVIKDALQRDPARRIPTAAALAERLRAATAAPRRRVPALLRYAAALGVIVFGAGAALQLRGPRLADGEVATIAVLPFANLTADPSNEHFADGMTEDVLTQLSRVPGLQVRSRTSVMRYKDTKQPVPEIGAALDVRYVLEGSVRRTGDDVRIAAQLIDARTDRHIWAETYDRRLTDLFLVQSEIARDIARALGARMTGGAGEMHSPADASAYEQFLLGRERFHLRTRESIEEAIALFRGTLARDPDYALAHAFLAHAYVRSTGPDFSRVGQREWLDSADHHARRAIALAPRLPDGYAALGAVFSRRGQRGDAIREFERALAVEPNYSLAMFELARAHGIDYHYTQAVLWIERALALDPGRADYRGYAATLYQGLGMSDEGRRHVLAGLRLNPADITLHWEAVQLEIEAGDTAAAARHLRDYLALRPAEHDRMMAWFEHTRGNNQAARPYVDRVLPSTTAWFDLNMYGYVYRAVGDSARGDSLIRRAREIARQGTSSHAGTSPTFDFLRAQAAIANGDQESALQYLESWVRGGGIRSWDGLERQEIWGELRTHPRFLDIVAQSRARRDLIRDSIRAQLAALRQ